MTEAKLYAFISRANTHEKIEAAKKWITAHVKDTNLWDDLMTALSQQSRMLYAEEQGHDWF